MNDEKKLNDEALENVSGGQGESLNANKVYIFAAKNCFHCSHNEVDCPYGGHKEAFKALNCDLDAVCPHKGA